MVDGDNDGDDFFGWHAMQVVRLTVNVLPVRMQNPKSSHAHNADATPSKDNVAPTHHNNLATDPITCQTSLRALLSLLPLLQ